MKFVSVLIRTSAVFAAIETVVKEIEAERKPAEGEVERVEEDRSVVERVEEGQSGVQTNGEKTEEEDNIEDEEVEKKVEPDDESSTIADWTIKVNRKF